MNKKWTLRVKKWILRECLPKKESINLISEPSKVSGVISETAVVQICSEKPPVFLYKCTKKTGGSSNENIIFCCVRMLCLLWKFAFLGEIQVHQLKIGVFTVYFKKSFKTADFFKPKSFVQFDCTDIIALSF